MPLNRINSIYNLMATIKCACRTNKSPGGFYIALKKCNINIEGVHRYKTNNEYKQQQNTTTNLRKGIPVSPDKKLERLVSLSEWRRLLNRLDIGSIQDMPLAY